MSDNMRQSDVAARVPLTGHAELIRRNVARRRKELQAYSPLSVRVVAAGLADAHVAGFQHMRALRGDRDERYRRYQVTGERALPIEDLVAIALEDDPAGREVVLAILRPIVRTLGLELRPIGADAGGGTAAVIEAKIRADQAGADLQHDLDRALADRVIDRTEEPGLRQRASAAREAIDHLEATVTAAVSASRPGAVEAAVESREAGLPEGGVCDAPAANSSTAASTAPALRMVSTGGGRP